jgi:hypothetical protein
MNSIRTVDYIELFPITSRSTWKLSKIGECGSMNSFQLLTSIKESKEFRIREVVGEIGTVAISLTDNQIIIIIKLFRPDKFG